MTSYRVFLRGASGMICGRDDFDAPDDANAMIIARALCDACSDVAQEFELWQGTRWLDTNYSQRSIESAAEIRRQAQEVVLERELVIRDTTWAIGKSDRLRRQTERLRRQITGVTET